jgi:hypothetical protein
VGTAALKQARIDAQASLEQAVDRARQLGLDNSEIESIVLRHIHAKGAST